MRALARAVIELAKQEFRKRKKLWLTAAVLALLAVSVVGLEKNRVDDPAPLSEVISLSKQGRIQEIAVEGIKLTGYEIGPDGEKKELVVSRLPGENNAAELIAVLQAEEVSVGPEGVQVVFPPPGRVWTYVKTVARTASLVGVLALLYFLIPYFRMITGSPGVSGKKIIERPDTSFGDVAGHDEAKLELKEIVDFLGDPGRFARVGARAPRGALLTGPPGTGKTLLARAVAGEARVPFYQASGSEFVEMFVGLGAARVRELFKKAKKDAPSVLFIDEIDAVGTGRAGAGLGGGLEYNQTLNQILVEMDGFEASSGVVVIGATNRPDFLDPALLRPGRFDRKINLDLPGAPDREEILRVHTRDKRLRAGVSLAEVARETQGFSGADLANLCNEAAILTARRGQEEVWKIHFDEAVERIIAGPEQKNRRVSAKEKAIAASHETGHALVAWMLPHAGRVRKISIIARSGSGGHTQLEWEEDRGLWTRSQLLDTLAVAMGGRAAEELMFKETTTGAQSDLELATRGAVEMVKKYGMGQELAPRVFRDEPFFPRHGTPEMGQMGYGPETAQAIDDEVAGILKEAYRRARDVLSENREFLEQATERLRQNDSLSAEELEEIFGEKATVETGDWESSSLKQPRDAR